MQNKASLQVIQRVRGTIADYPSQFWILFGGTLVNAAGSSLIFPFFTLYVRQRFGVPMMAIGPYSTIWSFRKNPSNLMMFSPLRSASGWSTRYMSVGPIPTIVLVASAR